MKDEKPKQTRRERKPAAVLYLRVSSAEQVAGTSLGTQERECRAACARLGLAVARTYRDEGKSAKSTVGRDGFAAAVAECQRTGAALVVYKFDRLARNAADALTTRDILVGRGARIISATEGEASASAMSKMVFGIASLVAEFDNTVRGERSRSGMTARAEAGGWCFRAPVGFRLARTAAGVPILEPDEDGGAESIRAAFAALAVGMMDETAAARAIEVGTGCTRKTAYAALRHPIYKGVLPAGKLGEERPAAFPGLVDAETWDAAQVRLGTAKVGEKKMKQNPRTPFVGVLYCAECGARLVGGFSRSHTGARHGYYRCLKCRGVSIPFAAAEKGIREGLEVVAASRDFLALVRANLEAWMATGGNADAERSLVAAARRTIAKEEARLDRARHALLDGLFTEAEFREAREDCEARLREARSVIVSHEKDGERRGEFFDALLSIAANPDALLALPLRAAKDALRAVCGKVTVGRDKALRFPEDSTVAILRAVAANDKGGGFNVSELAPLPALLSNPEGFAGVIRAAEALRDCVGVAPGVESCGSHTAAACGACPAR